MLSTLNVVQKQSAVNTGSAFTLTYYDVFPSGDIVIDIRTVVGILAFGRHITCIASDSRRNSTEKNIYHLYINYTLTQAFGSMSPQNTMVPGVSDTWYLVCNQTSSATKSRLGSRETSDGFTGTDSRGSLDQTESVVRWSRERPSSLHPPFTFLHPGGSIESSSKEAAHRMNYHSSGVLI